MAHFLGAKYAEVNCLILKRGGNRNKFLIIVFEFFTDHEKVSLSSKAMDDTVGNAWAVLPS